MPVKTSLSSVGISLLSRHHSTEPSLDPDGWCVGGVKWTFFLLCSAYMESYVLMWDVHHFINETDSCRMTDSTKLEEIRNQVEGQQVNDVYFLLDGFNQRCFSLWKWYTVFDNCTFDNEWTLWVLSHRLWAGLMTCLSCYHHTSQFGVIPEHQYGGQTHEERFKSIFHININTINQVCSCFSVLLGENTFSGYLKINPPWCLTSKWVWVPHSHLQL